MHAARVVPELPVGDVERAQRWYADVLGAVPVWVWGDGDFGAVRLGDAELYLVRRPDPQAVRCYLHVGDADAFAARAVGAFTADPDRGGAVVEPIEDRPWAMRELSVSDPWGNVVRVGHPLRTVFETPGFDVSEAEPPEDGVAYA